MRLYGTEWKDDASPLAIELKCIKKGGTWVDHEGYVCGLGLEGHFKNAMHLMWPEDDDHRWSDMIIKSLTTADVSVILGSSDSGKTYSVAKFIITDWWADPMKRLWLVSSTEKRGAELRIWGKLKEFFNRARKLFPWLPGKVLESKSCITPSEITDDGSEGRLLTQGIIFVPTKSGSTYTGLSPWIGVKPPPGGKLGHAGDECFPAGTMVDTPSGPRAIETIMPGELVICATGEGRVRHTMDRVSSSLVEVILNDGRRIKCTPNHGFMTQKGWKRACELNQSSYMLSSNETMCIMRGTIPTNFERQILSDMPRGKVQSYLQELRYWISQKSVGNEDILFDSMRRAASFERFGVPQEVLYPGSIREDCCNSDGETRGTREGQEDVHSNHAQVAFGNDARGTLGTREIHQHEVEGHWAQADDTRREWNRANESGMATSADVSRGNAELPGEDWEMERERIPSCLQSGLRNSCNQVSHRSGWRKSWSIEEEGSRQEEGAVLGGAWVESITVLKCSNFGLQNSGSSSCGCRVYNLEVEPSHTYSVEGLCVSNCQLMQHSFLDAYANWYGKENFQGILTGNPADLEDPLCTAAEPEDGWDNWKDSGKTQEWKAKFYGAHVICLDGRDTPNNDFPYVGGKPKFPYLIGKKKLDSVKAMYGENDWHWWHQCVGKPQTSVQARRVITRAAVDHNNAYDEVIWQDNVRTKVCSLDAAYGGVGGDRCVITAGQFGKDVSGKVVLAPDKWDLVPISVANNAESADIQIAKFCKDYCESRNIPATNFFFDGRGTLAVALARVWSPEVNVVDFAGPATARVVSNDEYIWDGDSQRRLKLCNEHYFNFVTELWFSLHYLIISGQMRNLDREVAREAFKRTWDYSRNNKIQVEPKKDMKERTLQSPDLTDGLAILAEGARRLGLEIGSVRSIQLVAADDYLLKELAKYDKMRKASSLKYDTAH